MRTPVFTGTCPALITPFDQRGNIDFDAFGRQIDTQIAAGVDAVCVCGTTGEASTLKRGEQVSAIAFCVKHVNRRVKVIAGTGSNNTAAAAEMTQLAQECGADAALLVTPYYNKTTQAGLIRHYEYIADRADIPVILYNVPSRTGLSFTAETYQALSKHPGINGTKEASGDLSLLIRTRRLCGEDFFIWSGNDDQTAAMMALGASGVISVASNLIPEVMVRLSRLCLEGRFTEAAELQIRYSELIDALFCEVNPIPVKAAMDLLGLGAGSPRLPLCAMTEEHTQRLKTAMKNAGILSC